MKHVSKKTICGVLAGVCLLFYGIACGGGGGGSDDPSTVEGNVSEQLSRIEKTDPSLAQQVAELLRFVSTAHAAVSGVEVSIRNTGLSTLTDDSGFFRIEGDFAGDIIIDFALDNAVVSLTLNVPAGTTVVLQDISVNTTTGEAIPSQTVVVDQGGGDPGSGNANDNSNGNGNANEDINENGSNSNDDFGNENEDDNENDDSGNSNESGNSNDDDSNNSNDDNDDDSANDNSGGGNSNDDNDNNSGSGGGDDDDNSGSGGGNSGSGGGDDDDGSEDD